MEIIIIWAIFIIIVIMNMNKAKKMQQERMQEHQRNMQEHNQNVQQTQNAYPVNGPLKQGTLSHGANLNREQQTYSGSQKMTSAEAERLKQQIRERNNFQGKTAGSDAVSSHRAEAPVPQYTAPPPAADNAAPVMKTFDKAEFHSPVMQAGSTGTYSVFSCFDFLFGLFRAFPLHKRPIQPALTSFLDFIVPSLCFNVQSEQL